MDFALQAFQTLGLSTAASANDVKNAFQRAALRHHPDKGGCAETFTKVHSAKEYLLNFWNFTPSECSSIQPAYLSHVDTLVQQKELAMQHAIREVLQRPRHWATMRETAFYQQFIDFVHTEITWVRKRDIKQLLHK